MSKRHDSSFAYWIYFFVVLLGLQFATPTTADEAGVISMEALAQHLRRRAGHLKVPITMPQPKRVAALVLNGAVEFKTA